MVRAGEASGTLDEVLLRLAEFTEKSVQLKQKVQSAMMYPVIMICIGSIIMTGLFVYVIPQITQIFADSGQQLPFLTRMIMAISHGIREYWWLAIIIGVSSAMYFRRWKSTPRGRVIWDGFKLKVPVLGPLVLMIGVSRFTRTLATLIRSGVPLLTALDITKNVLGNEILVAIIDEARVAVKEGASLGEPLKRSGRFPPIVTHMISTGEKSGALEEMLGVVSDAYDTQVESRVSGLTSLLEPIMIVAMGVVIGIIVFAVLMPILQMNEFIK
jgi:general secretion pathway protein F